MEGRGEGRGCPSCEVCEVVREGGALMGRPGSGTFFHLSAEPVDEEEEEEENKEGFSKTACTVEITHSGRPIVLHAV